MRKFDRLLRRFVGACFIVVVRGPASSLWSLTFKVQNRVADKSQPLLIHFDPFSITATIRTRQNLSVITHIFNIVSSARVGVGRRRWGVWCDPESFLYHRASLNVVSSMRGKRGSEKLVNFFYRNSASIKRWKYRIIERNWKEWG